MYLIVGARGTLGRRVAVRLLDEGHRVRLVSRDPDGLSTLAAKGGETVRGDLLEDGWQKAALDGVERVVLASHGLVPPSRRNHPGAVDGLGARRLIDAAGRAGVAQFVYISVVNADRSTAAFTRVKHATERHLQDRGMPWTIVRPTVFTETHGLTLMGVPLRAGRRVPFFGPGTATLNWISADDVAEDVVRALHDPATRGTVREVRGPDNLSRVEVFELIERAIGRPGRRLHVPLAAVRVLHAMGRVAHPGLGYLLGLVLAEEADGGAAQKTEATWVGPTTVRDVVARWAAQDQAGR
jgi:uncharacterized protein YbjT (DUF2867 family)